MWHPLSAALALLPLLLANAQTVYQAEDGILSGTEILTSEVGFTGTGYVGSFDQGTDSVTITVSSTTLQLYDLNVTYQAPYGDKYTSMTLNNAGGSQIHFPPTTEFTTVSGGQVLLNPGNNTITFTSNWGWYNIDKITLTPSPPRPPHKISSRLVNPNSNALTQRLLRFLISRYGKGILSGQQDPASYL